MQDVRDEHVVPLLPLRPAETGQVDVTGDEVEFRMAFPEDRLGPRQVENRCLEAFDRLDQVGRMRTGTAADIEQAAGGRALRQAGQLRQIAAVEAAEVIEGAEEIVGLIGVVLESLTPGAGLGVAGPHRGRHLGPELVEEPFFSGDHGDRVGVLVGQELAVRGQAEGLAFTLDEAEGDQPGKQTQGAARVGSERGRDPLQVVG